MDRVCDYCNGQFDDSLDNCPHCGATNNFVRRSDDTPKTISELETWYKLRNLPSYDVTRFYIGIDTRAPRAFGIYKDKVTGDFIVYKNKDDGTRAVRYQGGDESYAVNELYMKLKETIAIKKGHAISQRNTQTYNSNYRQSPNYNRPSNYNRSPNRRPSNPNLRTLIPILIIVFAVIILIASNNGKYGSGSYHPSNSYNYGSSYDYNYGGSSYNYGGSSYDNDNSWSWDWDSDSDWDSWDSWDSDWGSDWDSDW